MTEQERADEDKPKLALGVSVEISGAKELAETADKLAAAGIAGATATLRSLCKPGADEAGSLIREVISGWRERNFIRSMAKTQALLNKLPNGDQLRTHPRVLHLAVTESSSTDDETLQDMWAGLLAGSCTDAEPDDAAVISMKLLGSLSSAGARLLNLASEQCAITIVAGLAALFGRELPLQSVMESARLRKVSDLNIAVVHLRELGLLNLRSSVGVDTVTLIPSYLGLEFLRECNPTSESEHSAAPALPQGVPEGEGWVRAVKLLHDG